MNTIPNMQNMIIKIYFSDFACARGLEEMS